MASTFGSSCPARPLNMRCLIAGQWLPCDGEQDVTRYVADPKLIIDAGANVGYSSVYFAKMYPRAKAIAFEVEQSNFDMLTRLSE